MQELDRANSGRNDLHHVDIGVFGKRARTIDHRDTIFGAESVCGDSRYWPGRFN